MSYFLIGLIVGVIVGWSSAHQMVKEECIRTGSFFVGDYTFECQVKSQPGEGE